MGDTGSVGEVQFALAGLESAVDASLALELDGCTDAEVLSVWTRLETVRRRLAAVEHAVIAQTARRNLAHTHGASSTAALARQVLRITPGEAKARVSAAEAAGPRVGLTGEPLGPIFGQVAAAQASGEISEHHASLIVKTVYALPGEVAASEGTSTEVFLVEQARILDPLVLAKVTTRLLETVDPDGEEPQARYRARMRGLDFAMRPDGSSRVSGELTAEATAFARAVLDPLARPKPTTEAGADQRTASQRRHDGFVDLLKLALRAGDLPSSGGVTTTLILTATVEEWESRAGHATTGHGALIPTREARTWTDGETRVITAVLTRARRIEAYSSSHRIFTEGQRLAMIARDLGCTFPGCDTPPTWCETHHIEEAGRGGPTSTDNGALLCRYHHHQFEAMGWRGAMINGTPHWIPPVWIDPRQEPRRNRTHHPELHDVH